MRSSLAQLLSLLLVLNSAGPTLAREAGQSSSMSQSPAPEPAPQIVRLNLTARGVREAIHLAVSAQEGEEQRRWKSLQVQMMGTPNEFMTVELRDGSEVSGIVPIIFDDQIVVRISSGERKLDRKTVRRVTRIVSGNKQKSAAIGALAGMAVAIPTFYYLTSDDSDVFSTKQRSWLALSLGFLVGGVAGGAIGGLAGNRSKSVVVYEAV